VLPARWFRDLVASDDLRLLSEMQVPPVLFLLLPGCQVLGALSDGGQPVFQTAGIVSIIFESLRPSRSRS